MQIRLKALTQLLVPALALSLLGSAAAGHASASAKVGRPHHAAKHATTKRPPTGRPARAGAARVTAPQGGGLPDLTPEEMQNASDGMRNLSNSTDLATLGDADAARGDWPKASAHYRQALDLWPGNDDAFQALATVPMRPETRPALSAIFSTVHFSSSLICCSALVV